MIDLPRPRAGWGRTEGVLTVLTGHSPQASVPDSLWQKSIDRSRPESTEWPPYRVVTRAKVLLMAGDGVANSHIATTLGISRPTVLNWRARFLSDGLDSVGKVRPGRGRKPGITAHEVQAIVEATLHEKPPGATQWSCRSMAKAGGVSPATVQRIWDAHGLQPHRVKTFKLSTDPAFVEKLTDRRRGAVPEPAGEGGGAVRGDVPDAVELR